MAAVCYGWYLEEEYFALDVADCVVLDERNLVLCSAISRAAFNDSVMCTAPSSGLHA